jgi:hypothetical protein
VIRRSLAIALALLCLAATGCGRGADRGDATAVAERFFAAVGSGDDAAACRLLAADTRKALEDEEQKPCRDAIGGVQIDRARPTAVELYLTNAQADLDNGERAFLSRTADGWRVSAAGCTTGEGPPEDVPMKCELEA